MILDGYTFYQIHIQGLTSAMEQVKREFYCLFDHFVMDENPTRALAPVKINYLSQPKMCKIQKYSIPVVHSTIYTLPC